MSKILTQMKKGDPQHSHEQNIVHLSTHEQLEFSSQSGDTTSFSRTENVVVHDEEH